MDLEHAVGQYLATGKTSQERQQALSQFVRWCGKERDLERLEPQAIVDYSQYVSGSSTNGRRRLTAVRDFLAFAYQNSLIAQDLASHIRLPTSRTRKVSTDAQARAEPERHSLTPEGLAEVKDRLARLQEDRRRTAEEMHRAAADKDMRENAPYHAAKERLGHLETLIRDLEHLVRTAEVVEKTNGVQHDTRVTQGSRVVVRNLTSGVESTYMLVAMPEANPAQGKISTDSPVGKALLNRTIGEEVHAPTPRGTTPLLIVSVE